MTEEETAKWIGEQAGQVLAAFVTKARKPWTPSRWDRYYRDWHRASYEWIAASIADGARFVDPDDTDVELKTAFEVLDLCRLNGGRALAQLPPRPQHILVKLDCNTGAVIDP